MRVRPPCENRKLFLYLHRRLFKTVKDMNQATRNQDCFMIGGWSVINELEHHNGKGGSSLKNSRQLDSYPGAPCRFFIYSTFLADNHQNIR